MQSIASIAIEELGKIERLLLPLITPAFAFYIITGYGITRWHFLPKRTIVYLHLLACGFFAALLLIHIAVRGRYALARHKIVNKWVDIAILSLLVIGIAAITILELR